ncbi:hypothetical protein E2C01_093419 [Portunus trituberculatus]|uniref:Uncharacterized protein n=1 Tax=Portunus trituberculatus TaxID=210409 RepID=A0A5B7JTG9_PORTR|nr:hypothetical protein [Portunus trituberculatus]
MGLSLRIVFGLSLNEASWT